MRFLITLSAALLFAASAQAFTLPWSRKSAADNPPPPPPKHERTIRPIVRMTPDFTFPGAGNKSRTLRSLRGQPVVIVVTERPKDRAFRKQLDKLAPLYSDFAARRTVFIAAFTKEGEGPVQSNVPFVVANNGPAVAGAFGVTDRFSIIILGPDGNVDYQTTKVIPGGRVLDVMQNTYSVQRINRKVGGG
jgi:hypothetical protein